MFAFAIAAAPLWADGHASGDAEAGEKAFKKCKSCHMIVDDAGETIVKGGKTGPNLWGLPGRTAGTLEGYKYGKSLAAAGEGGLVWDEAEFTAFVQNPKDYLQKRLDDKKARSKMSFKVKKGGEDIWAYIASVSPTPE
ncbi:MAG: c-type cytochrome [Pseudomonadota bacterium]